MQFNGNMCQVLRDISVSRLTWLYCKWIILVQATTSRPFLPCTHLNESIHRFSNDVYLRDTSTLSITIANFTTKVLKGNSEGTSRSFHFIPLRRVGGPSAKAVFQGALSRGCAAQDL